MLEQEGSLQGLSEVWKGMEKASKGREVAMSLAGDEVREQVKQARAEVLGACKAAICCYCAKGQEVRFAEEQHSPCWIHEAVGELCNAAMLQELQPAAKDLEELLSSRSRHAAAVRDGEWVALMDVLGAEFREDLAPIDYVNMALHKQEALLREAELKGLKSDCIGVDDRLDSHNHNRDCVHCQRIAELEKARASEKRSKGEQTTGS